MINRTNLPPAEMQGKPTVEGKMLSDSLQSAGGGASLSPEAEDPEDI